MEKVKQSRKGPKTYTYWMASWREGGKTRNVHLGSARKMDEEAARQKARERKVEGLGYLFWQKFDDRAWPGVKAGRCDGNALQDLALLVSTPPQDCCAASISRRRVSGNCGTAAPGYESHVVN